MTATRPYALVLFGATGFTGVLCARYLAGKLPAGAPWCVALCDETETLLSAGNGPLVHMWSWKGGSTKPAARLAGHAASVCALAVDDGCIVSADTAGRLRVRRQPIFKDGERVKIH